MILLDTNVVPEAITREPHPRVREWLDAQSAETLFLSSITIAELLFGIGALPAGKRTNALAAAIDDVLDGLPPVSCHSIPRQRGAMPISPSRRARLERDSPRPMATSRRSLLRMGSPWHRATRAPSMPQA